MTTARGHQLVSIGEPLVLASYDLHVGATDALVEVRGAGVCHTDLGFSFEGVRTKHPLPLTLGHEISGIVREAPNPALVGRSVVVPAVIPCGACELCAKGRGTICRAQTFIGSDTHGGFADLVVAPARGLAVVDEERLAARGLDIADLSVVADAVSTAYQAVVRSELSKGDVAIVVGAGGVGGFTVQIARAKGAHVVALDVSKARLELMAEHGASIVIDAAADPKEIRKQISSVAGERGWPKTEWRIFETSGRPKGQNLAFSLLGFGSILTVIGYTLDEIEIRLSNLMAFDATARGNWGCLPELYPAAIEAVLSGDIALAPFIERHPMGRINEVFQGLRRGELTKRPVLIPDFGGTTR
jgi:6-hydroxycyclohex-1-ene-1-carbonyl-CoA dehydrogenase